MLNPELLNHFYTSKNASVAMKDISAGLWWKNHFSLAENFEADLDKLLFLAFHADNLSTVFNVGYQFALRKMFGEILPDMREGNALSCLCVSEKGGNSPKAIECYADEYGLSGVKTFVSCAPQLDHLLVLFDDQRELRSDNSESAISEENRKSSKKSLKIAFIKDVIKHKGVNIENGKPARFLPDIDKGSLILESAELSQMTILEGDAHNHYSKPFSVLEGLYIRLASVAYLLRFCLSLSKDRVLQSEVLSEINVLVGLAKSNKQMPYYQLLLDAHARRLSILLARIESLLESQGEDFKSQWNRDKVIFFMDTQLRTKRLEQAWQAIDSLCNP